MPIQLYGIITLVKLPGYILRAAIPLWNKNDLFTLKPSDFYSRKSVPKGSYAGVTGCSCAALCTGLGEGLTQQLCRQCAWYTSRMLQPPMNLQTAACILLNYAGRSFLFGKPLKPSRRENQEGRNANGSATAKGGSSDMILQCTNAAKLCWGVQRNRSRRKGGGRVLPVAFPLCNPLTWLSQQGGTELCSLSEILSATEGHLKRRGGKR